MSALLENDPDFRRLSEKKHISWEQNDVFLNTLWETLKTRPYFADYMSAPEQTLAGDVALWKTIFSEELEDDDALAAILEDASIHWAEDLPYALGCCLRSLDGILATKRWDFPPLDQSDILSARGKEGVTSDRSFVHSLVTAAYGRYAEYDALVASSVSKWDKERLYTSDIVLIALGLAEAETFPDIPVRVTINEYVEISKYYSTPKSHGFVNGLLDRLIRERMDKGLINKAL